MNNTSSQPWVQQGYLSEEDFQAGQIADFLENYPSSEVLKRTDLFNRILDENDISPATKIHSDRTFILGELLTDIRKIPEQYYSSTLLRFANANLSDGGKTFEAQLKEFWPEVELKPNLNFNELQTRAKKIANGLNNLYKIALYRQAQGDLNTVSVLKNKSEEELKQLLEKVRAIDTAVAAKIKNQEPLDKKVPGLVEVIQASGRTNLEIDDIFASTDKFATRTKIIDIIQTMLESLAVIGQARKDNALDKLAKIEGITEEFSRLLEADSERFFASINSQ